ncbi:hypothetical protein DPMN_030787 [Dreissena polymorpha]|uniref:Uncharacterized protein n=1 Tax=Dreissena polymorpha TaxID=45954 RepID=A0A9D4M0M1_DREPO|nr:hypothetical protein DPMN_030787 [Dreissena polymorpha]
MQDLKSPWKSLGKLSNPSNSTLASDVMFVASSTNKKQLLESPMLTATNRTPGMHACKIKEAFWKTVCIHVRKRPSQMILR